MLNNKSLNFGGKLIALNQVLVMGIVNVTPDSFYDGGEIKNDNDLLIRVGKMLEEGADLVDIGGMSSRPGASIIELEEELKRVLPAVKTIIKAFPNALISVDTIRSEVARQSISEGASLVNDISAGRFDPDMYKIVGQLGVPYVLMHMKGKPKTMQKSPEYDNVVLEVLDFFIQEINKLKKSGVKDIILDVGFGFGKAIHHNYQLLKNLSVFEMLEKPMLAGLSRKSMIGRVLEIPPDEGLNGTTALNMLALMQGANILRVHDVKEAKQTIKLWETYQSA